MPQGQNIKEGEQKSFSSEPHTPSILESVRDEKNPGHGSYNICTIFE